MGILSGQMVVEGVVVDVGDLQACETVAGCGWGVGLVHVVQ